jgi:hypothetical protein
MRAKVVRQGLIPPVDGFNVACENRQVQGLKELTRFSLIFFIDLVLPRARVIPIMPLWHRELAWPSSPVTYSSHLFVDMVVLM